MKMQDKKAIQNRATPVIGFAGLLIGLLVNAAITIELNEYDETIRDMVIITYQQQRFFL
ncbi:hypothetical protein FXV91_07915 [Methanosarcina sp. DH2]|jgi:ABC-type lipoprotein release transport system permease subunit|uniref:hypothetical protein n=1 Tax=Methanosarcina sp. DH2 TaxID=2605639 RepID=UPI001E2E8271|nr:hypothetical protein [Methanosarcina sp. DH2]MCC4770122.1 hypothetical protein [Methanosarcina sp. DH2]